MSKEITIPSLHGYDYAEDAYDLKSALEVAGNVPFGTPTKAELHAAVMGANDDAGWYWVITVDGKNYLISGSCDYTGWDCQAGATVTEHRTVEDAINAAPEKEEYYDRPIRKWLQAQVDGKLQIGVVDAI